MFKIGNLDEIEQNMKSGVWDFTVDGHCSNCGSCCSNLLPITRAEINKIRKYVRLKGIKPQLHRYPTAQATMDAVCPFRNNSTRRCEIYEVRPAICRDFQCDKPKRGVSANLGLYKGRVEYVLMRQTFFPEK